jgi:glycosyltransferase involved in cell wall biosynthesis
MTRAAHEYDVWFFEEPMIEAAAVPRLEQRCVADQVTVAVPVVPPGLSPRQMARVQRRLVDRALRQFGKRRRVYWYYTPMALEFTRHLGADVCVYDNMDELSAFRNAPPALLALEQELFARCDLVFCGGQSLYEAKRGRHASVHSFPSSIDREHFARARSCATDPPDQAKLGRPRLGFFGVIDERMDLELVDRLARQRPAWQWIMLGPLAKIDTASLPRRDNLHWLGQRSYDELPGYLAHWDVGIMPFALNESTRFISPTKTPEFIAAGVPVVSSPITDVVRPYGERGLVEIASNDEQWLTKAEHLLRRGRASWLADVDLFLSGISWARTWQGMRALIRSLHDAPAFERAAGRTRVGNTLSVGVGGPVAGAFNEGAGHI